MPPTPLPNALLSLIATKAKPPPPKAKPPPPKPPPPKARPPPPKAKPPPPKAAVFPVIKPPIMIQPPAVIQPPIVFRPPAVIRTPVSLPPPQAPSSTTPSPPQVPLSTAPVMIYDDSTPQEETDDGAGESEDTGVSDMGVSSLLSPGMNSYVVPMPPATNYPPTLQYPPDTSPSIQAPSYLGPSYSSPSSQPSSSPSIVPGPSSELFIPPGFFDVPSYSMDFNLRAPVEPSPSVPQPPPAEAEAPNYILWISIGVASLLVLGVIVWFFSGKRKVADTNLNGGFEPENRPAPKAAPKPAPKLHNNNNNGD